MGSPVTVNIDDLSIEIDRQNSRVFVRPPRGFRTGVEVPISTGREGDHLVVDVRPDLHDDVVNVRLGRTPGEAWFPLVFLPGLSVSVDCGIGIISIHSLVGDHEGFSQKTVPLGVAPISEKTVESVPD
ncbi:MAG: hypothetical protein AAB690_01670 [Patescibacteria group bacterium]